MRLPRLLALLTLTALLAVACGDSSDDASLPGIRVVDPDTGAATIADPPDDLVILDVRKPHEAAIVKLGADLLRPHEEVIAGDVSGIPRDRPIVGHCKLGGRSAKAAAALIDSGSTDVSEFVTSTY